MLTPIIILSACVTSVYSSGLEDGSTVPDRVFDYGLYETVLDPELCQKQLRVMRPFEFYDASFRIPQSIMKGNFVSLGNFHQCLSISQNVNDDAIEGKYCMIRINADTTTLPLLTGDDWQDGVAWVDLNYNSTEAVNAYEKIRNDVVRQKLRVEGNDILNAVAFSLALCIPKVCSVDDILKPLSNNTAINFKYEEEFCRLPGDKPLVAADYIAIAVFSAVGILTILSTSYDIWKRFVLGNDPGKISRLLRCFSVFTNTKRLLTFSSTPDAVDCIDGIRVISIMWVIIGHTFLSFLTKYTTNLFDFLEWYDQRRVIWLRSAELSVDTFFVLSGLLLVYTSVKKMKQRQLLQNLHMFYLLRFLRMFPLLACAVLLQSSVFNQVSDGVNWHYMAENVQRCRDHWWSALLHVQNIANPTTSCLPQSWYLSVDFQLHMLSPLVLFWVLGGQRSAWNGLTIGLVASLTASTVYCFLKDFSTGLTYLVYYYTNTLTRAPPFFVGMVFGYILHMYRGKKLRLNVVWVSFGYASACAASSYCLYVAYADWDSEIVENLNLSFMRSCWGLSVCWIIFACAHGYGGPINWFLSLKIWKFMARISYAMYLFHYSVLFAISGSTVVLFYFSMESMFLVFASVMAYTVVTSVAACVLVDAPCSTLQKLLLNASSPSITSTTAKEPAPATPQNLT